MESRGWVCWLLIRLLCQNWSSLSNWYFFLLLLHSLSLHLSDFPLLTVHIFFSLLLLTCLYLPYLPLPALPWPRLLLNLQIQLQKLLISSIHPSSLLLILHPLDNLEGNNKEVNKEGVEELNQNTTVIFVLCKELNLKTSCDWENLFCLLHNIHNVTNGIFTFRQWY